MFALSNPKTDVDGLERFRESKNCYGKIRVWKKAKGSFEILRK
jgi:hypothetical protein